jgi:hypothetical protein
MLELMGIRKFTCYANPHFINLFKIKANFQGQIMLSLSDQRLILKFSLVTIFGCLIFFSSCGKDVPHVKLAKTDFTLKLPYDEETSPFARVKSLKTDMQGNYYILDSEKLLIFKFDPEGNFIKLFGGEGNKCGNLSAPAGIDTYKDSLLLVYNTGSVDLLDLDGNCLSHFFIRGFADISISPLGTIVLNRMNYALDLGFFIETYNLNGKQLKTFGPTLGRKYQNRDADFAFTGFTSDNHLVYVPAFLDSIFIYDLDGNILKRARRSIPESMTPKIDAPLELLVEDVCVVNDRIFVARVDKKKSTFSEIYVRHIAEYNMDLKLVQNYELPESLTMSIESLAVSPWYHKFVVKDGLFLFMVSKPVEHFVAFAPKN